MSAAVWPRWLVVSVALHAAAIAGLWGWSQTTERVGLPAPSASSMTVTLIDPRTVDSPVPAARPPAPHRMTPVAPARAPRELGPGASPRVDSVPAAPRPTTLPDPDAAPLKPADLPEESSLALGAPAEPTPDAVADDDRNNEAAAHAAAHARYRPLVLGILARAKRYPVLAQRRGLEGTVTVAFLINADGRISDPRVVSASPHRMLDAATLAMVRRIESLPPPPDRIPVHFPVSIQYKLEPVASPISTEGARP